jgi:NADP-reducing hydrogenase subunit HndC
MPTLVNNVETLANVPAIILFGSEKYRRVGTEESKGTKVFTLLGKVNHKGYIEVPMGTTMREIIENYAGGMQAGSTFKLALTGGSSGSIVPAALQDIPLAYEAYKEAGIFLGSGSLLVCDQHTCIIDLLKVVFKFFKKESCGRCAPCRIGSRKGSEILTRISEGKGRETDLETLELFADQLKEGANCGLGNAVGIPLTGGMKYFRDEIAAHILEGCCPAGVCQMTALAGIEEGEMQYDSLNR